MRNVSDAKKVSSAVENLLNVLEEANLTEEETCDALKAVEVALGIKPPMPPHHPPMGPEGRPPMPPHHPPMGPEGRPSMPPHMKNC